MIHRNVPFDNVPNYTELCQMYKADGFFPPLVVRT